MKVTIKHINQFLLLVILITAIMYYGKPLLVPVVMACLLAMLMAPVCRRLDKKITRGLSALICVIMLLAAISGVFTLVSLQISNFYKDLPNIEKKANQIADNTQVYIDERFGLSNEKQDGIIKKQINEIGKSTGAFLGELLGGIATTLSATILTLVFTFLLLFGKEKYEVFFLKLFGQADSTEVRKTLEEISKVSQQYITGRFFSMTLKALLYAVGLSIIGIKNGILLGCLAGLLGIFPYIGPLIGGLFPVLMSMVSADSSRTGWVLLLMVTVQFFDGILIEPAVVGSKVKLSGLATILIIIIGEHLWGIVGMAIFVPIMGIIKIICTHVAALHPYAYLIGDPDEKEESFISKCRKNFRKKNNKPLNEIH
jgi:predicted PurR-regulated permease PerM